MILPKPFHCAHEISLPDGTKAEFPLNEARYPFIFDNSAGLGYALFNLYTEEF